MPGAWDDCFDPGVVALAVSGLVVSENSGTCGCFGERFPPFVGPDAYNARTYSVTTHASPTLAATSTGSGCSWANCGTVSGSSIPGTWSSGSIQGGGWCGSLGAFGIVNETSTTTGLNIWYWRVRLYFQSTATVSCAGLVQPVWKAELGLASDPQPDCHEPTGLTWNGLTDGFPVYPRWHEAARTALKIRHVEAGTTYGCSCLYAYGSAEPPGMVQNALTVTVT